LALRAKLNLGGDIFFLILLRKIRKKMSPPKEYSAAAGGKKNLFSQPPIFDGYRRFASSKTDTPGFSILRGWRRF
jgi:hypothetical protein